PRKLRTAAAETEGKNHVPRNLGLVPTCVRGQIVPTLSQIIDYASEAWPVPRIEWIQLHWDIDLVDSRQRVRRRMNVEGVRHRPHDGQPVSNLRHLRQVLADLQAR